MTDEGRYQKTRRRRPEPEFISYYGKPILKKPTWAALDIAGYLFLGGLAGASSVMAAAAQVTRRPTLALGAKLGATGAIGLSLAALVHDLGKPSRFVNMLRVFKPTSPMNMGSWLLSVYAPASAACTLSAVTGAFPIMGALGTGASAVLGPAVAAYTAVLIADTAVPAWHEGRKEMPFVFVSSAASSAAGLGLLVAPLAETAPLRRLALIAGAAEIVMTKTMEKRMGLVGEAYKDGKSGPYLQAAAAATGAGALGAAVFGGRNRIAGAVSGLCLLAGAALTRFGIFHAGVASAQDPKYTVTPQRQRLAAANAAATGTP